MIPEPYRAAIAYGALVDASEFQKDILMVQQFQGAYQDWRNRFLAYKNTFDTSQAHQFEIMGVRPYPSRNDVDQGY